MLGFSIWIKLVGLCMTSIGEYDTPKPLHIPTLEEQIQTTLERLKGIEESLASPEDGQGVNADGLLRESFLLGIDIGSRMGSNKDRRQKRGGANNTEINESEERFRLLVESTKDYAIYMLDPLGFITSWNEGAERIKGYSAEEIIGQNYSRFYTPEAVQQGIPKKLLATALTEGRVEAEGWRVRKDGSRFWATVVITALWDSQGRLRGFSKVVRDITARKEAEEALLRQAEVVKLLHDVAVAANEAKSMEEAIQYALARVCSFTGWQIGHALFPGADSQENLSSTGMWYVSQPEELQEFREALESASINPEEGLPGMVSRTAGPVWITDISQSPEFVRKEAAASSYLKTAVAFPILIGRRVAGILEFYTRDILEQDAGIIDVMAHLGTQLGRVVERSQSEAALRHSEARFRTIFEGAPVGIELADLKGRLLECNPALQRMLGFSQEEIKLLAQGGINSPADLAVDSVMIEELQTGKQSVYRQERPFKRRDGGTFWGRLSMSLLRDNSDKLQYAIGMVEDITERKQMEAELGELQRRLMEGREIERLHLALDLHDGPMQELYGLLYHIKAYAQEQPENADMQSLQDMQLTLQRVILTLRTICGELRPPSLTQFGLEKAIASHADLFQDEHPELSVQLELAPDGQLLPEQIRLGLYRIYQQALTNVVRHAEARQIWVRLMLDGGRVILEVQDDGVGFKLPARWIELARQGHLGLVGASERAEGIGGQLKVESMPGQGTLVRVEVHL